MRLSRRRAALGAALAGSLLAAVSLAPGDPQPAPGTAAAASATPAVRPSLPASGHAPLVVDRALLDLMHGYLLERSDAARAGALQQHLQRALAPGDYEQAAALVERYLAYMAAHDALLAIHKPLPGDLRRMAI